MGRIVTVYCEGAKGSHDYDILDKVFDGISGGIRIKPVGGKRSAGAIMEFEEKRLTARSDFYLFFRDRDFDCPMPEDAKLFRGDGNEKIYYSHRITIENYLLDPLLFYTFIETEHLAKKYGIGSENEVIDIFINAAKELRYYQAVRHTLGKLRERNSFGTTWIKDGSGHLPSDLTLETCRKNGWKLIDNAVSTISNKWTEPNFDSDLRYFIDSFDDIFFDELKFLSCFQGKDFSKALSNKLPGVPMKNYYSFAKKHFDYTQFNDLVELRSIIEKAI